ncbi:hypothetical protein GGTG_06819 [Gaeumannomyces tritici R3-111a-1]|uniref:Uncharacterized protein n=1 Tax=Gaeumannomyces tritici (strain R3-111a-1) TaxID=644352 RepID=J3NZX2_GAET3|nr:hypothetical protein GGTG_06819 [Gaeumannomyces tritici R3-111a-1]EJT76905.1 hypothetical protein GGTG_06819 [Gaeumannomyces tritici R3-111a-1]
MTVTCKTSKRTMILPGYIRRQRGTGGRALKRWQRPVGHSIPGVAVFKVENDDAKATLKLGLNPTHGVLVRISRRTRFRAKVPSCDHVVEVARSVDAAAKGFKCFTPCEKVLQCGHMFRILCVRGESDDIIYQLYGRIVWLPIRHLRLFARANAIRADHAPLAFADAKSGVPIYAVRSLVSRRAIRTSKSVPDGRTIITGLPFTVLYLSERESGTYDDIKPANTAYSAARGAVLLNETSDPVVYHSRHQLCNPCRHGDALKAAMGRTWEEAGKREHGENPPSILDVTETALTDKVDKGLPDGEREDGKADVKPRHQTLSRIRPRLASPDPLAPSFDAVLARRSRRLITNRLPYAPGRCDRAPVDAAPWSYLTDLDSKHRFLPPLHARLRKAFPWQECVFVVTIAYFTSVTAMVEDEDTVYWRYERRP